MAGAEVTRARAAAVAAVAVAGLQAAVLLAAEVTLDAALLARAGIVLAPLALRLTAAAATVVPWLAVAVLYLGGRSWAAIGTLLAAGALTLPAPVSLLAELDELLAGPGAATSVVGWWSLLAGLAVLPVAVAAVVLGWRARPPGPVRDGAPGVTGGYLAVAVVTWLGSVLAPTALVPPGAPRRLVELPARALDGVPASSATLVGALGLAVVLWLAPRVRPVMGAAAALTVAGSLLLAQPYRGWLVASDPLLIATPAGVLAVLAAVGLPVVAVGWLRRTGQ